MSELEQTVYTNKANVEDLQNWQRRQNGSLQRIEGKVDKLYYIIIGAVLAEVVFKFIK